MECSNRDCNDEFKNQESKFVQGRNAIKFRETKDRVRVSPQDYLFTGSSKVTSCGFWQKRVRLSDLLEGGLNSTPGTCLPTVLLVLPNYFKAALKGMHLRGQTEPKRWFSLILADSRLFLEQNKAFKNQEKGVLAKGVSVESSVTAKETKSTQGYWAQRYIWHSERHSQERPAYLEKTPSKNPLFLVPEAFEKRREFRRKSLTFARNRRKLQEPTGSCRFVFVPLASIVPSSAIICPTMLEVGWALKFICFRLQGPLGGSFCQKPLARHDSNIASF